MAITFLDPTIMPYVASYLFVYALVFGLMSYVKTEDKDKHKSTMFNKKVNALLALAIAAFAVMYEPLVEGLMTYLPIASIVFILLFFVMFIKNALGGKKDDKPHNPFPTIVALAIMLVLLGISYTNLTPYIPNGIDPSNVFWGIGILVAVLFFWMIYKTGD